MTDAPVTSAPARWRVITALGAVYVVWGSTYLAIRFAIETLPPFLMAGTRFLVAGALLYAWSRRRGTPRPTRGQWRAAVIVGGLLLTCGNGGIVYAERLAPSGVVALLVGTVPLWMALLDWLRPGGVRPTLGVVIGLICGFVGIVLLVSPSQLGGGGVNPFGVGVVLVAAVGWAAGSLYSRSGRLPTAPLMSTAVEMLAGGALLIVVGTLTGEWSHLRLSAVSPRSALGLVYLITFGSLVGFTAYIWLLRTVSASLASTYAYVNPVVAVFLGWAFDAEPLTVRTLLAAAVIVGGVVVISTFQVRANGHAHKRAVVDASAGAGCDGPTIAEPPSLRA
jgi:drug/metabolite transporter (DMT)-like permease